MARNQVQFQKSISLPEFIMQFDTQEQCHDALFKWRWPNGFKCPECGRPGHCKIHARSVYQCHRCHHQTYVTSGTIFEYSKLPLPTWFLELYLLKFTGVGKFVNRANSA